MVNTHTNADGWVKQIVDSMICDFNRNREFGMDSESAKKAVLDNTSAGPKSISVFLGLITKPVAGISVS